MAYSFRYDIINCSKVQVWHLARYISEQKRQNEDRVAKLELKTTPHIRNRKGSLAWVMFCLMAHPGGP
jgi:hypothetical protein